MKDLRNIGLWGRTVLAFAMAGVGAMVGFYLNFPAYLLTGSALFVSVATLAGLRLEIHPLVRDAAFLVLGTGIGSLVTAETLGAIATWPFAFVVLAVALVATMGLCQWLLRTVFGFDVRSATLASAPGHLSYVIAMSAEMGIDPLRVTVVQSVRLLALTLLVPVLALVLGVEIAGNPLSGNSVLPWLDFAALLFISLFVGLLMKRFGLPAPLLVGALFVSSVAHGASWTTGGLHPSLGLVAFVLLGALIGTRFSGIGWTAFRGAVGAGVAVTLISGAIALAASVPVAVLLGMPISTVLAAFAPGGFETMVALGAVLGANPSFVAATHVVRLALLTGLVPLMLAWMTRRVAE
ncbi:AbrB family transcriptional regulator [Thalassococcus sp. S3]|uniref:AbrB family transcriptional regulator n=1 Tax=Thalassococcus sp. S3 TaxID=2017482 RepID=UPI0013EEAFAD|nr:AbrB family transcriptional regulator [Thalassococcus sp. S3]